MCYHKLTSELLANLREQGYCYLFDAGPLETEKEEGADADDDNYLLIPFKERFFNMEVAGGCFEIDGPRTQQLIHADHQAFWLGSLETVGALCS